MRNYDAKAAIREAGDAPKKVDISEHVATTESASVNSAEREAKLEAREIEQCRTTSVLMALDLHRGKALPAVEIVREASIIARYLHEGVVSPAPEMSPVTPQGVVVPLG